jgi:hypothetical protein
LKTSEGKKIGTRGPGPDFPHWNGQRSIDSESTGDKLRSGVPALAILSPHRRQLLTCRLSREQSQGHKKERGFWRFPNVMMK